MSVAARSVSIFRSMCSSRMISSRNSSIIAKDVEARDRLHRKLETVLADQFPGLVTRIAPLELGPPVGWPVQYRVSGPDVEKVRDIALDLAKAMGKKSHCHADQFRLDRTGARRSCRRSIRIRRGFLD